MEINEFKRKVNDFLIDCFGADILNNKIERNYRFFEEATELVQACGMTRQECYKLIDYVYGRPKGSIAQELGGVMVTLFGLASAQELDINYCAEEEIKSCYRNIHRIRSKWINKTIKSGGDPLPGNPS